MADTRHFRHPAFKMAMDGFFFLLPRDWEVSGYILEDVARGGQFSFSTEGGSQGQFSWRKVKAVPDQERIMEEVHRRHLGEESKMRFTRHGQAFLGHTRQGERFYASAFNLKKMFLFEWVFPKYTKDLADTVAAMLETFTLNEPEDGRQFYALCGLEVSVPADYHFTKFEPYPAAVTMVFENARHYTITTHRFGMVNVYMQGANVTNFYHRCLYARRFAIRSAVTVDPVAGNETAEVQYRARGKFGFDFLLGPWWHGFGSAFHKVSENRVYAFEHLASHLSKPREKLKDIFRQKLQEKS